MSEWGDKFMGYLECFQHVKAEVLESKIRKDWEEAIIKAVQEDYGNNEIHSIGTYLPERTNQTLRGLKNRPRMRDRWVDWGSMKNQNPTNAIVQKAMQLAAKNVIKPTYHTKMKEQLVSFECGKLAKECGFDWKVTSHFRDQEKKP